MPHAPMKGPDTVVFDLGNVVVGWDPYGPFSGSLSRAEWEEFTEAADFFRLNELADAGMPLAEVIALAEDKNARHGILVREYYQGFERSLTGPIPGTEQIVDDLHTQGFRLLGLTNWSAETFSFASAAAPAINQLEAVMISGKEGIAKPNLQIFRRLIARFALRPQATVFIDDSPANVKAAQSLGFVALPFVGALQLRHDLTQLGVLS